MVDWAMQLIGAKAKTVYSDLKRIAAAGDAEDHVRILIKGENGVTADIYLSGAAALGKPGWLILGTHGACEIEDGRCRLKYLDRKKLGKVAANAQTPRVDAAFGNAEVLPWIEEEFEAKPAVQPNFWVELHKAATGRGKGRWEPEAARPAGLFVARKRSRLRATEPWKAQVTRDLAAQH